MRAKAILTVLAATFAAAMLLPALAMAATPASRQSKPEVLEELSTQGTNGFSIHVTVENGRKLTLGVDGAGRGSGFSATIYKLPMRLARRPDEIKARLGRLGRIDMRFVADSVSEEPATGPACNGPDSVFEKGHWVGLIVFHGEQAYTRVDAHRAKGEISKIPALTCHEPNPNSAEMKKLERELEELEDKEGETEAEEAEGFQQLALTALVGEEVALVASRTSGEMKGKKVSMSTFAVVGKRRVGRIEETSLDFLLYEPGSDFMLPDPEQPTSGALLKPPAPFSGTATFRRHPAGEQATWTGDLKVDLPGFGLVRLAGPGVKASMCEAPNCPESSGLADRTGPNLVP